MAGLDGRANLEKGVTVEKERKGVEVGGVRKEEG